MSEKLHHDQLFDQLFDRLADEAAACVICERMRERKAVLSRLSSPRKPSGANDKPSRSEIRNCSDFLRRQIELINPPVVATLGAVALNALMLIEPHDYQLRDAAAKILRWNGRLLVPLYHPSPQVVITVRTLEEQKRDFRSILRAIKRSNVE